MRIGRAATGVRSSPVKMIILLSYRADSNTSANLFAESKGVWGSQLPTMDCRLTGKKSGKIAAFDLDSTLLKPHKGVRPKDRDDAVLAYPNVIEVLNALVADGYLIVIFTNQGSKVVPEDIYYKVDKYLIPGIDIYIAQGHTVYRKPSPKMLDVCLKNNAGEGISVSDIFYVGDAAGRPNDFAKSDLEFAYNCNVPFYTPEEYFLKQTTSVPAVVPLKPLVPKTFTKRCTSPTVIICTGYPGCGKSTFAAEYSRTHTDTQCVIVNNDTLKTRAMKVYTTALKNGVQCIIVDNCNYKKTSRLAYIEPALDANYKVWHLHFDVPLEHAVLWNWWRAYSADGTFVPEIAYKMYTSHWEPPGDDEGYTFSATIVPKVPKEVYKYVAQ